MDEFMMKLIELPFYFDKENDGDRNFFFRRLGFIDGLKSQILAIDKFDAFAVNQEYREMLEETLKYAELNL